MEIAVVFPANRAPFGAMAGSGSGSCHSTASFRTFIFDGD